MNTFKVSFLSPDNQILFNEVVSLLINGHEGELVVLAYHSPYLIYLLPGVITVKMSDRIKESVVVDSGVLEVAANNCRIMTNQAHILNYTIRDVEHLKSKKG